MDYEVNVTINGHRRVRSRAMSFSGSIDPVPQGADVIGTVLAQCQQSRAIEISKMPTPDSDPPRIQTKHPEVQGRCPSCGNETLFLGTGGFVTCSVIGCQDPTAATELLADTDEEPREDPMNKAIRLDRERMKAAVSMAAEPTITKLPEEAVTGEETPEQAAVRVNQELRRTAEARLQEFAAKETRAKKDAEDRADAAECRALELTAKVDTFENLITDFAAAMTDGPFGLPWWLKASRAFDAMTDLAGADQG